MDETPGVVLAVYAHPDDADVGCGGTLARWAKAGSAVHLVDLRCDWEDARRAGAGVLIEPQEVRQRTRR